MSFKPLLKKQKVTLCSTYVMKSVCSYTCIYLKEKKWHCFMLF